jgi:hypothetical protein
MGSLDIPNYYSGLISISKKILAHGAAMICPFITAFLSGDIFLTKTNYQ